MCRDCGVKSRTIGQFRSLSGALGVDVSVCEVYQGNYEAEEEEAEDEDEILSVTNRDAFASERGDLEGKTKELNVEAGGELGKMMQRWRH